MTTVMRVLDIRATLGEGPVWCPRDQVLYWVDILSQTVNRFDPGSGANRVWRVPDLVGSMALREGGGAILALRHGFAFLNFETGNVKPAAAPDDIGADMRFNDGKCDRRGRFFAGTMHNPETAALGKLYRLDADGTLQVVEDGIVTSNGLGWSPDDAVFYYTDTMAHAIHAYDYDVEAGTLSNRRLFAEVPHDAGRPDGLTVDSQGYVWGTHWEGWRVTRYAPDGAVDKVIDMPVARPTSCGFGGRDLSTLYITSAAMDGIFPVGEREPQAGSIFAVPCEVAGLPEPRFAG